MRPHTLKAANARRHMHRPDRDGGVAESSRTQPLTGAGVFPPPGSSRGNPSPGRRVPPPGSRHTSCASLPPLVGCLPLASYLLIYQNLLASAEQEVPSRLKRSSYLGIVLSGPNQKEEPETTVPGILPLASDVHQSGALISPSRVREQRRLESRSPPLQVKSKC